MPHMSSDIYSYELYQSMRLSIRVNYIKVPLDSMITIFRLIFFFQMILLFEPGKNALEVITFTLFSGFKK